MPTRCGTDDVFTRIDPAGRKMVVATDGTTLDGYHDLLVEIITNHPRVGFNFNLCQWLKVDGSKDFRPLLRENSEKLFAVTINGATLGAKTWTNGLIRPLNEGDFDQRPLLATLRERRPGNFVT
jgi:sugar phosphate isomerase/epimerase